MPKEISLGATISQLDKVTKELKEAKVELVPKEQKKLELKIKSLQKVRKELVEICKTTSFFVVPPVGPSPNAKKKR
jgi:hypothetical protein